MTGLVSALGSRGRPAAWFVALAGLQVVLVLSLLNVNPEIPISMVILALIAAPFLLVLLLAFPTGVILAVPFLLLIPLWVFGFTVSELVLLAGMLLIGLRFMVSGKRAEAPRVVEVVFALYVVWMAMSVFQAVDGKSALSGLKLNLMFFLAFLAGRRILGARRAPRLIRCVAALGIVIGLQLAATVAMSGYSLALIVGRLGSDVGWGYSNYVAAVAALTAAASIALAFYGRAWERVLGIGGILSAVMVSIVTVSRGGTLALVIGLVAAAAVEVRRRFWAAMALITVMAAAYLFSPLGQASLERFVRPGDLPSVAARIVFFQETLRVIAEHRILGIGPNQLPFHTFIYIGQNPHNFLLKNAVELGVPGLGLYLLLLLMVARGVWRFRKSAGREARIERLTLILALVIAVVNGMYEPTLGGWVYGCVFWMLAGALYAASADDGRSTG
jgi:O-antigen ligase